MDEALRLFAFCEATRWCVMPVQGGIYDQNPRLLALWEIIFDEKAKHQQEEKARQDAQRRRPQGR